MKTNSHVFRLIPTLYAYRETKSPTESQINIYRINWPLHWSRVKILQLIEKKNHFHRELFNAQKLEENIFFNLERVCTRGGGVDREGERES